MAHKIMAAAWVLLAVAALGYVHQYGIWVQQSSVKGTFVVDGKAKLNIVPDIAKFSVSVVSEGMQVSDVQKGNTEKMNAVQAFLKESGIDKKDMQTTQYALSPRYEYPVCNGTSPCSSVPRINGYTLTQELTVKVRNTDAVGDIVSGVTGKGANSVSNVVFTVDDDQDARSAARAEAIADAKKKAKDIAKTGGFSLGRLVSIAEGQSNNPMPMYAAAVDRGGVASSKAGGMTEPAPSIEPGTQESIVTESLTFEIIE